MKVKREGCLACNGTGKHSGGSFMYLLAFKHDIKRRKDIPEGIKDLIIPLIQGFIVVLKNLPGAMELAARRGVNEEEAKESRKAMKKAREGK